MKKIILWASLASLLSGGCIVIQSKGQPSNSSQKKKCPPGHVWSDGKCHNKGKGNENKGKGSNNGKGNNGNNGKGSNNGNGKGKGNGNGY